MNIQLGIVNNKMTFANLELDTEKLTLSHTKTHESVTLVRKEFLLLEYFFPNPHQADITFENTDADNIKYPMILYGDEVQKITLKLDKISKIKLTGDTSVTSLANELTDNSNIDFNGYTLYVNNKALS